VPSQPNSEDTMTFMGDDTIKVSQSGTLLPKAPSLSFEHAQPSTSLASAGAVRSDDAQALPSPVTDNSYGSPRKRRRGDAGFRISLRRAWGKMGAAWRGFGFSGSDALLEPIDVDDADPNSPLPISSTTPDYADDDEVDEVIVDNLTQASSSNTQSETGFDSDKEAEADEMGVLDTEQRPSRRRLFTPYYLFRRTVWKRLRRVFATRFAERVLEERYQYETWIVSKVSTRDCLERLVHIASSRMLLRLQCFYLSTGQVSRSIPSRNHSHLLDSLHCAVPQTLCQYCLT
jgi:hypothetical protein